MYQSFLAFIKEKVFVKDGDKVLLAVSGGVDSMVLLDLMRKSELCTAVAHVNYHLRGEDSDLDAELVESTCKKLNIPFHKHDVEPCVYNSSESIQMVARTIRYDFLNELSDKYSYSKIATAHNANDNLETIIFNLTKGTGISGLQGIAAENANLIRPILFSTKEEIYRYAKENGLEWREDASNKKDDYSRNLIRNKVIPVLKQINPSMEETFAGSLARFRGTATLVQREVERIRKDFQTMDGLKLGWISDDDLSKMLLFELIKNYGFNYSQSLDMFQAALNRNSGTLFHSDSFTINLDRDKLLICPNTDDQEIDMEIPDGEKQVLVHGKHFSFEKKIGNDFHSSPNIAFLDADKLKFPLKLRNWKEGDYFQPLGMQGKKKVSDFMIDSKIPVKLKNHVLILESRGEIVWLVGLRIDDRFKVTGSTNEILKVKIADA